MQQTFSYLIQGIRIHWFSVLAHSLEQRGLKMSQDFLVSRVSFHLLEQTQNNHITQNNFYSHERGWVTHQTHKTTTRTAAYTEVGLLDYTLNSMQDVHTLCEKA